jgi:3-deoxy-D-manno-octulosonic-acid transferase
MRFRVYTGLVAVALLAGFGPAAVARRVARGVPLHLRARMGFPRRPEPQNASGWIHAVSVGEAIAAAPLVSGLRRLYPDLPLVMTTTTETGARVVRERYANEVAHRFFPLDLPGAVARVTDSIRPAFMITMETELWPNVLRHLARRRVPVMIANGRLSDRSFPRYRRARHLLAPVLGYVTVFAMQSAEDARRVIALGAPAERVFVTGNLKNDAGVDPGGIELWQRLLALAPGQPVWIAGSTHAGEEEIVLEAHARLAVRRPDLALIVAPRHPERVRDVEGLVRSYGFAPVRRSELPRRRDRRTVLLLDTVGELAKLYAVADVVFVGGSLARVGGHNLLEPALRRKPVLFGPHTANFREAAALLLDGGGGIVVHDAETLAKQVGQLLDEPDARRARGDAAFQAAASRSGAVKETLELIERFLVPARQQ